MRHGVMIKEKEALSAHIKSMNSRRFVIVYTW